MERMQELVVQRNILDESIFGMMEANTINFSLFTIRDRSDDVFNSI